MSAVAKFKHVRISSEKVRGVLDLVRGKRLQDAINILDLNTRRVSKIVKKAIKSAAANANVKGGIDLDNLYVSKIFVGQGPSLKRWKAKSRGMAGPVCKRTSHITVELSEK